MKRVTGPADAGNGRGTRGGVDMRGGEDEACPTSRSSYAYADVSDSIEEDDERGCSADIRG